MAKKKAPASKPTPGGAKARAAKSGTAPAKAASRNTASAPSRPSAGPESDALAQKAAATDALVASVPYNSNKPGEFGRRNAVNPPEGFAVEAATPTVGSSTITESNASDKTGTGDAIEGMNPLVDPLDRVRVDNSGRALTTNQGVPIADNQNSLKAGLRGPTLLEDFILREKITHFDHERIPERIVHARGSAAHGYFEA